MTTHLKRNTSIDLFNLLPLPDERNAMDSYLDMPNNFYILDGKNSRLLQLTKRREFNRKTIDGNEGSVLEIPFLEGVFGTKYFVVNKVTGSMMGIFDDKVEMVEAEAQLQPLNLQQLQHVVCTLEQKHQGFDVSSFADSEHHGNTQEMQGPTQDQRLQYPTTHKNFNTFDNLKSLRYKGTMLTVERRFQLYWDHTRVIAEMADAYNVFSRLLFFQPEIIDQYKPNRTKYSMSHTSLILLDTWMFTFRRTNPCIQS